MKILAIDDKSQNLYLLEVLLKSVGYEVVTANDGIDALEKLRAGSFDGIVSDILMPRMDGFRLLRECKKNPVFRQIPFIFYTASFMDQKDEEFGLSLGAIRYIIKPVKPEELLRQIRDAFQEHAQFPRDYTMQPVPDELTFSREYTHRVGIKLENQTHLLEESEEKYRLLYDNTLDAILLTRTDGSILAANPAACAIFQRTEDEIIKNGSTGVIDSMDPRFPAALGEWSRIGRFRGELTFLRKDGTRFPGEISTNIFSDHQGYTLTSMIIRDISGQKKAEEILKESHFLLKDAMDLADLAHWVYDVPSETFTFNDQFYALYGTTAEREGGYFMTAEVYSREFVHPEDRHVVTDEVEKMIRTVDPDYVSRTEARIIRRDGEIRYFVISLRIIKDAQGRTIKSYGANQDITERKRTEEKNRQLAAIVESSDDAIIGKTLDGIITSWNKGAEKIYGYTGQEIIGKSVTTLAPPGLEKELQEIIEKLMRGESVEYFETTRIRKDGNLIQISLTISPILDNGGKIIGASTIARDITVQKIVENALKESEEMFRNPVEQSPVGVFLIQNNLIRYINPKFAEMFQYSRDELLGKPFDLITNTDGRKYVQEMITLWLGSQRNKTGILEFQGIRKDGDRINIEMYGSPMIYRQLPAIYGTLVDITVRKKMENDIKISLDEKKMLLKEIHHRVKNNMQVISSLLLLQSQSLKDEGIKTLFLESITRIKSIALVHEQLYRSDNLSQIEYGGYIQKMFGPLFESYRVDTRKIAMVIEADNVMVTIEKAVPCSLIINELISNSLKHAFPGDSKGEIHIRFTLDDAKENYVLDYSDNGIGLPKGFVPGKSGSLGTTLIEGLTNQLLGKLTLVPDQGIHYILTFPSRELRGK